MIQKLRMPEATDGILKIDRRVADKMSIDLFSELTPSDTQKHNTHDLGSA